MDFYLTTAIFTRITPYSDRAIIASLFSYERGAFSVFMTQANLKLGGGLAIAAPLNEVEIVVYKNRGELWRCRECRLKNSFLKLRNSWNQLQAATTLLQAINFSQPIDRPSEFLYLLLKDYLHRLEEGEIPWKIVASFYLKILRLEGLWSDELPSEIPFTLEEWSACLFLTYCRQAQHLREAIVEDQEEFMKKIKILFEIRLECH